MSETPSSDEVDREVLQMFNGLDPSLIAATLDSSEYNGQLVRQLWQSWPQNTRDTVLGEVQPEIREFFVREIHDVPSLTEALVACLGFDKVKVLMNDLLRKAKGEASPTLKDRAVAMTRVLVQLRAAPKRGPLPPPSALPSPDLPTSITTFNDASNTPPPAKAPLPSLPSSNHRNAQLTLGTNTANLTPAPGADKSTAILPDAVVQTQRSDAGLLERAQDTNSPLLSLTAPDIASSRLLPSPQPPAHSSPLPCSPKQVDPSTSAVDLPTVPSPHQPSPLLDANAVKQANPNSTLPSPQSQGCDQSPSPAESEPCNSPSSVPPAEGLFQAENDGDNTTPATETTQSDHEEEDTAAQTEDARFHPKGWSVELNAKKVAEWGLENAIDNDKRHTAAARTEWMYECRLNGRTEQEYAELTASEFRKFAAIPPLVRKEAGMVFNKTSKFDYEARVLLGLVAFEYCKMTAEEGRKYMDKSLKKLEKRLPDISPKHEKRRIDEEGVEPVRRWWNDIKTWITTVAGKMRKLLDAKGNAIQLLDVPKKSVKYDPVDLLCRKRAGVAFHLWGATDAGKEICEPLIKAAVSEWAAAHPAEDGRTKGQKALCFGQEVRKAQFDLQSDDVKAHFHKEAKTPDVPQTDEQRQGATEVCLPWIIQILNQASTILGMHVVVLMSGKTLGEGVPVIVKEFMNDEVEAGSFLDDGTIGGRAKADYFSYAAKLHQVDPAQLRLYDRSVAETMAKESDKEKPSQSAKNSSTSTPISTGKPNQKAKSLHRVFDPPPTIKARGSKGEFVSKFLGQWFASVFAEKINWTKVSRDNSRYVELGRLPKDTAGRTIQLMNPTAMTDDAFHLLWDHLYKSTRGQVANDVRFLWRGEDLHFNLPAVPRPADSSVHVAGEQARKTKLGKRKHGGTKPAPKGSKQSRKKKRLVDDSDDDLDELLEAAGSLKPPKASGASTRELRARKSSMQAPKAVESDQESSVSESGGEYAPDDEDAGEHIDIDAFATDGDLPMDGDDVEQGLMGEEDGVVAKHAASGPTDDLQDVEDSFGGRVDDVGMEVDLPVVGDAGGKGPADSSTDVEKDGALDGESGDKQEDVNVEGLGDELEEEGDEAELAIGPQTEGLAEVDYDAMDWGPQSSSAVDESLPLMEISLAAPQAQQSPTENPAWERVMTYLRLWGQKMSGVSKSSREICLSQGVGKECSISIPPALDSAISIMQIWVSLQNHKPCKPDLKVGVEPFLNLDSVLPRHHVRQAVELVLDVTKPLPNALYTQFEVGLVRFIFDASATTEVVRYSDVQPLSALRLASFIHMSAFLRDPGKQGPTSSRIEKILDCFVVVLAAIAVVRYMQEFLGSAVDEWISKTRADRSISSMWLALKVLWSPSVDSLARAVVTKRTDLFVDRWAESHLPAPTIAIVQHILAKPAWWETSLEGLPLPFQFGTKQRLFTPSFGATILASEWSLLTFLDRSVILLMLFACAVQLSGEEHRKEQDVLNFTELLRAFCSRVNTSETEGGSFYSSSFHDDAIQREVQGWIAVWESERTVVVPSEEVPEDDVPPTAGSPTQSHTGVVSEFMTSNQGPPVLPASSSAASSPASLGERTDANPPVETEEGPADSGRPVVGDSHSNSDGVGVDVQDDVGDSTEHPTRLQGKKRKVRVGRPTVPEPSVGAGVDPKKRLQDAVKKAKASGTMVPEERPRRAATLKSPYASSTAALRAKAEVAKAPASPEKKSAGKKKPVALLKKAQAADKATSPSVKQPTTSKGAAVSSAEQSDIPLTPAQKRAATIAKRKAAATLAASTGSQNATPRAA